MAQLVPHRSGLFLYLLHSGFVNTTKPFVKTTNCTVVRSATPRWWTCDGLAAPCAALSTPRSLRPSWIATPSCQWTAEHAPSTASGRPRPVRGSHLSRSRRMQGMRQDRVRMPRRTQGRSTPPTGVQAAVALSQRFNV